MSEARLVEPEKIPVKTTNKDGRADYQKYYMRIYRASDIEKASLKGVLEGVLKLHFEIDNLKRQTGLNFAEVPKPVLTIKTTVKDESDLAMIKVKPKVLEPLIPFYAQFAREFHRKYPSVKSEDVERRVRHYQTFTIESLEKCIPILEKEKGQLLLIRILQEQRNAEKVLEERFVGSNLETLENREQAWLNAMLVLYAEGFNFFESKLASDKFAFGLGEPDDPYVYFDNKHPFLEKRVSVLKVWNHPKVMEWKRRELEDIQIKEKAFLEGLQKTRENERWEAKLRRELTGYLTRFIQKGFDKDDLVKELQRASYTATSTSIALEMFDSLCKTVKPKILRMKVVEEEDSSVLTQKFDQAVTAYIQAGLTDEEIINRLRSDPELQKIDGPNLDLWKGRLRQIRQSLGTSV